MRRGVPIIGVLAIVALVGGCGSGPEKLDGAAEPVGLSRSSSTSTGASAGTSAATGDSGTGESGEVPSDEANRPTPITTTAKPETRVLGSDGFGKLELGMSRKQAEATGLLTQVDLSVRNDLCNAEYELEADAPVFLSTKLGIASITAYADVATPEGIKLGSSSKALLEAYPDWASRTDDGVNGRGWAVVPGNDQAYYNISLLNGKVDQLMLQLKDQDCYE